MKWTLEQFLTNIRFRLDESDDRDYLKDSELTTYLNIAFLDMTDDLLLRNVKIVPAPHTNRLLLTDIFLEEDRFGSIEQLFVGGRLLPVVNVEQGKREQLPYQYGDYLFFPEVIDQDIEIYYIQTPLTLQDTQEVSDIPERYQHVPIDLVIAFVKEKDEERGQANEARSIYEMNKHKMRTERQHRETHQGYNTVNIFDYGE